MTDIVQATPRHGSGAFQYGRRKADGSYFFLSFFLPSPRGDFNLIIRHTHTLDFLSLEINSRIPDDVDIL